jgi:hypothetical protein
MQVSMFVFTLGFALHMIITRVLHIDLQKRSD